MAETYFTTKRSAKSGGGRIVYIDPRWGFIPGEMVEVAMYPIGKRKLMKKAVKKVSYTGESQGLYVPKKWGFADDDMLVVSVRRVRDTGVGTKKGDQELP